VDVKLQLDCVASYVAWALKMLSCACLICWGVGVGVVGKGVGTSGWRESLRSC